MNPNEFRDFVKAASRRAVLCPGRIGGLVLTQTAKNREPRIREPEMRHALAQVAELMGDVYYGIEVPTRGTYRFVPVGGENKVSARHDFVVLQGASYDAVRLNLVELKKDQPGIPAISKDFQKLIRESAEHGKSMLHICHAANRRTVNSVLKKYNDALYAALTKARQYATEHKLQWPLDDASWFTLFIFVVRKRGRDGGNRPWLCEQRCGQFGKVLDRVARGEMVFQETLLECDEVARADA
ncbi:MAG TPA: hypothetical protein VND64_19645 [Pirellulales bacterium]|nr:hypothetical protein [Pirellulales bacterium]